MNHTPGPWKVVGNSVYQYYVAGAHEVVDGKGIKGRECCIGREDASKEIEANTRLIASAPELLEALKRLVLAFDVGDTKHTTLNGRGYAALDESRKAIAKAKS